MNNKIEKNLDFTCSTCFCLYQLLETYEKETKPVLDFYGPEMVHTIDSTSTPVNVLRDILRVIAKIQVG